MVYPAHVYVAQDGADFYLFTDPGASDHVDTLSCPDGVKNDRDMPGAIHARAWFVDVINWLNMKVTWI